MKTILFLLINLLILPQQANDESLILWGEKQLTWDDFNGKADKKARFDAYSYIGFSFELSISSQKEVHAKVVTSFDAKQSWAKKQTPELLKHEQVHFDIAEIYTRKMNAELQKLIARKRTKEAEYKAVYTKYMKQYNQFQKKYDSETKHGIVPKMQEKWNADIKKRLPQTE